MRFVSTGHIDTQNGEAALGATLVAANEPTPQTLPLLRLSIYIASEGTGFCTHAHKDDENWDLVRLAKTVFLPVMNIRKILCLICLFLQAIVIAIANEGERSAHVGI